MRMRMCVGGKGVGVVEPNQTSGSDLKTCRQDVYDLM